MPKKTQYCEQTGELLVCHKSEKGYGSCGDDFDNCIYAKEIKDE